MKVFKFCSITLIAMLVLTSCNKTAVQEQNNESRVTLGQVMAVLNSPIFVTNNKSYWKDQGLQMKLRPFVAGRLALDALLSGDVDVATIAETPIAYAFYKHKHLKIIATVMESNEDIKVIARKDAAISTPGDLKGKRVGVFFGTNGQFYAFRFLSSAGLSENDVKLINIKAPDMVAALSNGNIDAYVSWEPHIQNGLSKLGDKVIVLRNSKIYTETWNLVTTEKFYNDRPETIRRMLKAVVRGVNHMNSNPGEAIDVVASNLGLKRSILKAIWKDYDFNVRLSNNLVTSLQTQGEWVKNSKGETSVPNYRDAIITQPLRAVMPSAVTIK